MIFLVSHDPKFLKLACIQTSSNLFNFLASDGKRKQKTEPARGIGYYDHLTTSFFTQVLYFVAKMLGILPLVDVNFGSKSYQRFCSLVSRVF